MFLVLAWWDDLYGDYAKKMHFVFSVFFNQHDFISFVVLELGRVRLCVCLYDKRVFFKFRASFFNSRAGFDFEARFFCLLVV